MRRDASDQEVTVTTDFAISSCGSRTQHELVHGVVGVVDPPLAGNSVHGTSQLGRIEQNKEFLFAPAVHFRGGGTSRNVKGDGAPGCTL